VGLGFSHATLSEARQLQIAEIYEKYQIIYQSVNKFAPE